MFDELLFPTDGSEGAAVALDHALAIAADHGATLHVLNVADTTRDSVAQVGGRVLDALEQEGAEVVRETAERASGRGVPTVTDVLQGAPAKTIADYAETYGMDLVVMPTRGRTGVGRFLLGSTTDRVLRRAAVPVLTVRPDEGVRVRYPYRSVLVPTDGSDPASAALAVGVDVADAVDAPIHLLSVVEATSLGVDVRAGLRVDALESGARAVLDAAAADVADAGVDVAASEVPVDVSVTRAIREYVEGHDVDLVVLGTHGRTGLDRYLLGSVAERLVRTAPVPVVTVRGDVD